MGLILAGVEFFGNQSDIILSHPMVSFPRRKQSQIDEKLHAVDYRPYKSPSDPLQQHGQPKQPWARASDHSLHEITMFNTGSVIMKQVLSSSCNNKLTWGDPLSHQPQGVQTARSMQG
jgi:hypothetical protein